MISLFLFFSLFLYFKWYYNEFPSIYIFCAFLFFFGGGKSLERELLGERTRTPLRLWHILANDPVRKLYQFACPVVFENAWLTTLIQNTSPYVWMTIFWIIAIQKAFTEHLLCVAYQPRYETHPPLCSLSATQITHIQRWLKVQVSVITYKYLWPGLISFSLQIATFWGKTLC